MKYSTVVILILFLSSSCSSQKEIVPSDRESSRQGERKGQPSTDEIFKMDANGDGKLSKDEVQGPLQRDFSKIDSDGDGYISKSELENAPRPKREQHQLKN